MSPSFCSTFAIVADRFCPEEIAMRRIYMIKKHTWLLGLLHTRVNTNNKAIMYKQNTVLKM